MRHSIPLNGYGLVYRAIYLFLHIYIIYRFFYYYSDDLMNIFTQKAFYPVSDYFLLVQFLDQRHDSF